MIAQWSYGLAAVTFAALLVWRLFSGARQPGQWLLLAGFALTACWAWLAAIAPDSAVVTFAETARNLVWVGLLHSLFDSGSDGPAEKSVRLVYGAVAAVLGMQMVADALLLAEFSTAVRDTADIAPNHRGGRRAGAGAQPLRPGVARQPHQHPLCDARAGADLDLRPQPLHHRLSRPDPRGRAWRLARRAGRADRRRCSRSPPSAKKAGRCACRARRPSSRCRCWRLCAYFAVMAIIATALRGSVARLAADARHRHPRRADRRRHGAAAKRPRAGLGQGEDRQASVRASLRLSHRMASLHRDAGRGRAWRRGAGDAGGQGVRRHRSMRPAGSCSNATGRRRSSSPPACNWPGNAPRAARYGEQPHLLGGGVGGRPGHRARWLCATAGRRRTTAAIPVPALAARRPRQLGRRAADPPRADDRPGRWSPRPNTGARSTGRISTCCAPPAGRRRARLPKRRGSARSPTRSGSRSSTAASPSSCTTSRIWSASCRC